MIQWEQSQKEILVALQKSNFTPEQVDALMMLFDTLCEMAIEAEETADSVGNRIDNLTLTG